MDGTKRNATFVKYGPSLWKARRSDFKIRVDPEFTQKLFDREKLANERQKRELKAAKCIEKEQKRKDQEDEHRNTKTMGSKDGEWIVKNKHAYSVHDVNASLTGCMIYLPIMLRQPHLI